MTPGLAIGIGGMAFLLGVGGGLWYAFGPVIFQAMTEFGQLICG